MKRFLVFTGKEWKELCKNYKFLVLAALLLLFGMTSPLLAKMMPELFSQIDMGVEFTIPTPTFLDAYAQFFKNMTQLCIIAVVLVFSGNIAQEVQKGTALLLFSKGLSRTAFLLSKFTAMSLVWSIGYALSAVACYAYTAFLFPEQAPQNLLPALLALWLLVEFILSLVVFGSVLFSQTYAALLTTGAVVVLLFLLQTIPAAADYSPLLLGSCGMELVAGGTALVDILPAMAVTLFLTVLFLLSAILLFRKKQL